MPVLYKIKDYLYDSSLIEYNPDDFTVSTPDKHLFGINNMICKAALNCGITESFLTKLNIQFGKTLPIKINHEILILSVKIVKELPLFRSYIISNFKDKKILIHHIKTLVKMKKLLPTVASLAMIATVKSQIAIGNPNVSHVFVPPEWSGRELNNGQAGSAAIKLPINRMFSPSSYLVKKVTTII